MNKRKKLLLGVAPSNIANPINPGFEQPEHFKELASMIHINGMGCELEFEQGVQPSDFDILEQRPLYLGVHQPINGIDVLDSNRRRSSLTAIKNMMDVAGKVEADYFTVHLQTVDRGWADEKARAEYAIESLEAFNDLVDYHKERSYNFPIYVENLEYPKYPATPREIGDLAIYLSGISFAPTGMVFDVSHLWRSRSLIYEATGGKLLGEGNNFQEYLQATLDEHKEIIKVLHITGCDGQRTHELPCLGDDVMPSSPNIALNSYHFPSILRTLLGHIATRESVIPITNEAFGLPYTTVINNNLQIIALANGDSHE